MKQEILRMERVSFLEQNVIQLDDFNLCVHSGDIMGLLPVNNHGLTSLLQLLQYNTALRYGYVYYCGRQINTWRTVKHRRNRIGLIQSESCLVEGLTVVDNIFVLRAGFKSWYIRPSILTKQLDPFLQSIGIHISAYAYVEELTAFEKTVVDVLKSVVAGCKLIVLRDISSYLSEYELDKIHRLIKYYSSQGFSFLYIDFHYEELRQICDKVALMSNGRIVKVMQTDEASSETFLYYTKTYSSKVKREMAHISDSIEDAPPIFEVKNLYGETACDLNFSVASGECLVLQDVDNYVFDELLSIFSGEIIPERGQIKLKNREILCKDNRDIAVIQELPSQTMLFKEMSYFDNLCITLDHRLKEVWRKRSVRKGILKEYSSLLNPEVFEQRVDRLSEIEKYRLVYIRIAIQKPKIVFCVQPFRRADIELRMHIWEFIKMLLDKKIAVVILAVNLADSLSLANRFIRLEKGKVSKVYQRNEFSTMSINAPWVDFYQQFSGEN